MKRFSHKDLIIAVGIVVAAIILVVSIYFKEASFLNENASGNTAPQKKIQPTVMIKKVLAKVSTTFHF